MSAQSALYGALAGAAGTAVLNATTYADMAIRGRPPSELPKQMVKEFARRLDAGPFRKPDELLSSEDRNRETALGALIGYADGIGAATLFGVMRPAVKNVSWFWAGLGLAAFTLVMSEGISTAMGRTDPREWGVSGWLSDIVPRALYGWTAAIAYDRLARDR